MKKKIRKSIFALLIICIAISCKKENVNKQNTSYTIKAIVVESNYIDTQFINTDSFLNLLRNDPYSSVPNTITHSNNNLNCVVQEDLQDPSSFSVFTTDNKIDNYASYVGYGSAGQYGYYNICNNYIYKDNRLDSLNYYYLADFIFQYTERRIKNLKFNYNSNLLVSFSGTDSLYYYQTPDTNNIKYNKLITCDFDYSHSYNNPQNEIHLDINDLVLNNIFYGYGINQNFIIQQLVTFSTKSEFLIEHAHYNYFNSNPQDISIMTLDLDISYLFDNLNRVESFTINTYRNSSSVSAIKYFIIYE